MKDASLNNPETNNQQPTTILVTGGKGQLASCIKAIENQCQDLKFIYTDREELDITSLSQVQDFFNANTIDYCVNCAAYTAVDQAEKDEAKAFEINALGAKNLALVCKDHNAILIHISTDFVFDGASNKPYTETDTPNPISVYGASKLQGEIEIQKALKEHFIIRTSWLYSEYGNNFMKTMLRLGEIRDELSVVNDQIGTPTYAGDLAEVMLQIIKTKTDIYGLYHYSHLGEISWYDFANVIFKFNKSNVKLHAIPSTEYPTPAKRPSYSVLDKSKITKLLAISVPNWEKRLEVVLYKCNL
ncbi:dTDP-4-dehydrorhamnose reductase [Tamlana sp. I1]|uniref:dTDP-4-dehydrorhamnose reductase n=1 Tax=Tamlana sp. I1 TaxID=2762061 RepID=UPI00188EDE8F|nr:dTDP-4-dehydrorhamnose reductase [Tamlana sp. I1]